MDPVAYVRDPRDFLGYTLVKAGGRVKGLLAVGDVDVVQPFVQALAASGMSFSSSISPGGAYSLVANIVS
jgi:hypothetical protein